MTRREFMGTGSALSAGFFLPNLNVNKAENPIIGHGDFRYKVHHEWGNLNPAERPVTNCHEMVMDNKGRLIMLGDNTKNNILIYDKSGKMLDFWGIRYKQGHGLTHWDAGGEEFLFITDPSWGGTKANGQSTVIKTTLYGREIMKIDHPANYGAYPDELNFAPTETAIAPNGDIYIADGYGACYILQFNHKGEFIRKFGGKGDAEDQFQTAHGVCIDDRDKDNPTLLVTSRAHNCFKRFTLEGKYIETISTPGAYVCRPVIDGDELYAGVCWSSKVLYDPERAEETHPYHIASDTGFVTILDKHNKVVSNPGGTAPVYENGALQPMVQELPVFHHCHDVCIDEDKNIYVCQWNADGAYPTKLERV